MVIAMFQLIAGMLIISLLYLANLPVLPITGMKLSWDGLPSLSLAFSADPWDQKTPTAL